MANVDDHIRALTVYVGTPGLSRCHRSEHRRLLGTLRRRKLQAAATNDDVGGMRLRGGLVRPRSPCSRVVDWPVGIKSPSPPVGIKGRSPSPPVGVKGRSPSPPVGVKGRSPSPPPGRKARAVGDWLCDGNLPKPLDELPLRTGWLRSARVHGGKLAELGPLSDVTLPNAAVLPAPAGSPALISDGRGGMRPPLPALRGDAAEECVATGIPDATTENIAPTTAQGDGARSPMEGYKPHSVWKKTKTKISVVRGFEDMCASSMLAIAVIRGELDTVRELLAGTADPNVQRDAKKQTSVDFLDRSPLQHAVGRRHFSIAEELIAALADPAVLSEKTQVRLLRHAAEEQHLVTLRSLLLARASAEAANSVGQTALMLAATAGHTEAVATLLDADADLRAIVHKTGRTALHCAAAEGHVAVLQELLERGAAATAKETNGDSPLVCSIAAGHLAAAEVLIAGGAVYERDLGQRMMHLRNSACEDMVVDIVHKAVLRARWNVGLMDTELPDLSDVSKYGFAARGQCLIQLHMLHDTLKMMHEESNSPVPFKVLTTKQVVEAYLKPLTSDKTDCGCPGCAWYMPGGPDEVPMCPGPHRLHCKTSGYMDACAFYHCCRKHAGGVRNKGGVDLRGFCRGCDGTGLSAVEWNKGGAVPAMYFASHSWNQSFYEDIVSITLFATDVCTMHSAGRAELCPSCEGFSFWVCALAINQHVPLHAQIIGEEGERATENCVKATFGITLLVDDALQAEPRRRRRRDGEPRPRAPLGLFRSKTTWSSWQASARTRPCSRWSSRCQISVKSLLTRPARRAARAARSPTAATGFRPFS
mmetsp:Transcript_109879/g.309909  ORF Transcript_109879/g.309909 Transcript_109879/m.309909 type:complete len:819 (+) Transcript_109879:58-2514(+)